jgi:hypothetical protein
VDLGIALGVGVLASIGGRTVGLSMRYARGFTPTAELGGSGALTGLRPEVLGVMLSFEKTAKAHLPN